MINQKPPNSSTTLQALLGIYRTLRTFVKLQEPHAHTHTNHPSQGLHTITTPVVRTITTIRIAIITTIRTIIPIVIIMIILTITLVINNMNLGRPHRQRPRSGVSAA